VKTSFERTTGKLLDVRGSCCLGLCAQGPLVRVELPDDSEAIYQQVSADSAVAIGQTLVDGGRPSAPQLDLEAPFFTRQVRIVTANAGRIDPVPWPSAGCSAPFDRPGVRACSERGSSIRLFNFA
jgi:(2Fe-2S) ferredoxin